MTTTQETKECSSCSFQGPLTAFGKSNQCLTCLSKANRRRKLRLRYGITPEDYDSLYQQQYGCCAICGTHQSKLPATLAVDHNHDTKEVRGLLCFDCNTGIGKLQDNYDIIIKAAEYLRSFTG
jgi:hypothetical protein